MRNVLAACAALLAASAARAEVPPVGPGAAMEAAGACRVESFTMTLEGWNRDRKLAVREACGLKPIDPQPTCKTGPCLNIGCRGLIHFHAVFQLPPGQSRQWPSCNFSQQRLGLRSHHDHGQRKLDQYEPVATMDFTGAVEGWGEGFRMEPVPGREDVYALDFYDLPGWAVTYPLGQPNAVSPVWFPLDWHYMYRAYLGPKRAGLTDADYRYVRVDMEADAEPAPSFKLDQQAASAEDWNAFSETLGRVPHP